MSSFWSWLIVGVVLVCVPAMARAAAQDDAAIEEAVQQILSEDYPGNLGPAKKKLQDQLAACVKKSCKGTIKGQIYVALGMVSSQLGQSDEAKQAFHSALNADPNALLPSSGVTPLIKAQFEAAKGKSEEPAAQPPGGLGAAVQLIQEALAAEQAGRFDLCIQKDRAALDIEEMPRTRLHLAACESRSGKLVDALKDAQKALEMGIKKKDAAVMRVARLRVKELLDRIPHVTFEPPRGVSDLVVKFDDRPVPTGSLKKKFSIDPGKHTVVAEGTVNGFPSVFEEEYDVAEKQLLTVRITLKPPATSVVTPGQIKCMLLAKSQEDVQKCLPQNRKNLVVQIAGNLSGYGDTNSVALYTPAFNASVASPTAGWNVGGNFLVDAVSAASPDIVASASPPFREYRYAGGITGGYKPGSYGAQGNASLSSSPDYVSYTGGLRLVADLNDKLVTPSVAYNYSYDRIGRGPNNWLHDITSTKGILQRHEFEAGVSLVLSPTMLLVVGGTLQLERGDQSQPYRYVPMFDPVNVAPYVPTGARIDLVNRTRLPVRSLEQLPTSRNRYAIAGRLNWRIGAGTLRVEERVYYDTWRMAASSSDGRYMYDLTRRLRVWPHGRLHVQTGANFYQLAYSAIVDPNNGTTIVPAYRTGDRELGPLLTLTGGGGVRFALGAPEGEIKYGITFTTDVMYTRYWKALYVRGRTAIYGTLGFDVEF